MLAQFIRTRTNWTQSLRVTAESGLIFIARWFPDDKLTRTYTNRARRRSIRLRVHYIKPGSPRRETCRTLPLADDNN